MGKYLRGMLLILAMLNISTEQRISKMNLGRRVTNCRMCNSNDLYEFLDLGFLPPADGILNNENINGPEIFFPLKVAQCQECGLTQLTYAVNPDVLYDE